MRTKLCGMLVGLVMAVGGLGISWHGTEAACVYCASSDACGVIMGDGAIWCRITCSGGACSCTQGGGSCTSGGGHKLADDAFGPDLPGDQEWMIANVSAVLFAFDEGAGSTSLGRATVLDTDLPSVSSAARSVASTLVRPMESVLLVKSMAMIARVAVTTIHGTTFGEGYAIRVSRGTTGAHVRIRARSQGRFIAPEQSFDLREDQVLLLPVFVAGRPCVLAIGAAAAAAGPAGDQHILSLHQTFTRSIGEYRQMLNDTMGWEIE